MARKAPAPAEKRSKAASTEKPAKAAVAEKPAASEKASKAVPDGKAAAAARAPAKQAGDPRQALLERAALNAEGAYVSRSDPLADAKAARAIAQFVGEHAKEMSRRGLDKAMTAAALQLAREMEEHLQALPAAAVSARGRSQEDAELLADAAATALAVREGVLRVTRGPEGRAIAHAWGLGEPLSVRQPAHVVRALHRILAAAKSHPDTAADVGLVADDLQTMKGLADDLAVPSAGPRVDEHRQLIEAQGALRAWFDLVAAKALLAFAGDPEERARLLALIPRADDRRHQRRPAGESSAA
jgi:hypothetical protein